MFAGIQPEVNIKKNPIYGKKDSDFVECDKQEKTNENSAVRVRVSKILPVFVDSFAYIECEFWLGGRD